MSVYGALDTGAVRIVDVVIKLTEIWVCQLRYIIIKLDQAGGRDKD